MIHKEEISQIGKWVCIWVGSWFVAFNIRDIISVKIPDPFHQILFGLGILMMVAFFWDIRKYYGNG